MTPVSVSDMNLFLLFPEFESVLSCTTFTGVPRIYNSKGLAALTHFYYPHFRLFASYTISLLGCLLCNVFRAGAYVISFITLLSIGDGQTLFY